MKRPISLFLVGALGVSAFARDANSDFRGFLTGELPRIAHAFERKDASYFDKISTPDFTEVDGGRTTKRKEAMAQMKAQFASVKRVLCHFDLLSSKVVGKVGTAMTKGHVSMTMMPDRKNKSHTYVLDIWERETWVKSGAGWKIQKLEQVKPPKMTMDGKPFDASKMGG